jgi:hypothetical protein
VARPSFASLKRELDEAFAFLRGFTLGHPGFTPRDGLAGVQRVSELCDRVHKLFGSGPYAGKAAAVVASGRTRVVAAMTRLALLRNKK